MRETLREKRSKLASLEKAREFHEQIIPQAKEHQKQVDNILNHEVIPEHQIPNYYGSRSQQIASRLHRQAEQQTEATEAAAQSSPERPTRSGSTGRYGRVSRRRAG
jgi:hypothetical protein